MLTLSGVSKSYGKRTLLDAVSLQLSRGDRLGLVGPNGAGKSTLFSLILGENTPDDGTIALERNASVGFLPQESAPVGDESVVEVACAITPDFVALRRAIHALDDAHPEDPEFGEHAHDGLHVRYRDLNGYQVEARAKQILAGLAFRPQDFDRPARELSGGWVMRAHLARLLVQAPDLLMLDEPTNHLDLESLLWFQQHLQAYPGALLVISHDREFLNGVVNGIVELRQQRLNRYTGSYDQFVAQRAAAEAQQLAAYQNQQKEIAHLQTFIDRFGVKATKAAQAQSKRKQIERMEKIEAPTSGEKTIGFRFPQPIRSGQRVVWLKQVDFAYGENPVYRGLDVEIERGERIVLVGPNGAGKSTLLKLLAARLQPQAGAHGFGHNVTAGYYSQYRVEMLRPERTVLEEAQDTPARVTEQAVRTLLGSFLFSGDAVEKKVQVLSGGEKSRLALVKLLLDPPNLLLMDEPTTHLDLSSIDALVDALKQFQGTLVFISHDVHFIKTLASKVIHVAAGKLTLYLGDYAFYLDKTRALSARAALTAGGESKSERKLSDQRAAQMKAAAVDPEKLARQQAHQQRQERVAEVKKLKPQVAKLEKEIAANAERTASLRAQLEQPELWQDAPRLKQVRSELEQLTRKAKELEGTWEPLASRLLELE
ncbi:MAG: ABC-F family ATP-binding cassette domain-containing protein [Planctomycetes bacterium]|nr:ABC-F family ATP-binding cassette domain-containing protein [Planctomycetota bacterium]